MTGGSLRDLAATSRAVRDSRRRLDKIGRLSSFLAELPPRAIESAVAYLCGTLPQGRIGVGFATVRDARAAAPARDSSLSIADLDEAFTEVASLHGPGSSAGRAARLRALFGRATADEQDFLVRLVCGELRQGALESVVSDAVAKAAGLPPARIRRAVMIAGGLAPVARAALTGGAAGLEQFALRVFRPIQPMLAQSAESVGEVRSRLGPFALDYKLDGVRVQVHKEGDEVRVYTRHLREVTGAVPEVLDAVRAMPARRLVLDGEVLALGADGRPLPFQVTMRRFGRTPDDRTILRALPLTPFFFDCLAVDADDLIDAPFRDRAAALDAATGGGWTIPRVLSPRPAEAEAFVDAARRGGHEGVMAKALGAGYEAGMRGAAWLKIKPAATLDLVVLAAEWGSGRRQGWLSNLHLGARDAAAGGFVMLGKTFKGLTDATLSWQTRRLLELETGRDRYTVYVRPLLVVEVAFNEVQASRRYPGGVALRFARVRRYRDDKAPGEADTIESVRALLPQPPAP